jgi:type II restriction enzyme
MSEGWIADNMYCPSCGNPHIAHLANNKPVADFQCDCCGEIFELKSKEGTLGKKIADGAYGTMIDRIMSSSNPDLFIMQYNEKYNITALTLIPKFFFVPDIIEKRKPLAPTARRAGWVGCNILISQIPQQGKIRVIQNKVLCDKSTVIDHYRKIKQLQTSNLESRGWLMDVLNCINQIPGDDFSLRNVYDFTEQLPQKHINNNHVEAKIRQQLQLLRDKGMIAFVERGHYRKVH